MSFNQTPKLNPKPDEHHRRQLWHDQDRGTIGYGKTYGETSYNNKPYRGNKKRPQQQPAQSSDRDE